MLDFLFRRKPSKLVTFEDQLRILAECGIHLGSTIANEQLEQAISREAVEHEPFRSLLCAMGQEIPGGVADSPGYFSDNIWHFDTECIEGHGDYRRIAQRMSTLAQGALPLEEIRDFVDVDGGTAWVSFSLDGQTLKWPAKVDGDWVDPTILTRFVHLLGSRDKAPGYTYIDLGGQDFLIGCCALTDKVALENRTGLSVKWLE